MSNVKEKARYALKNGVLMPASMQRNVIAIEQGKLPKLLKYAMSFNLAEMRYEFSKAFKTYLLHKELNIFRQAEQFVDSFYISWAEHSEVFARIHVTGFSDGQWLIINTATLQAQNGLGAMLEGSAWEQLIGPRLIKLLDSLEDKRKSEIQQIHIATGIA